jgi:hypothetical protein
MRLLVVAAVAFACSTAHADGIYFTESIGVSLPRGDLQPYVIQPMKVRLAVGARVKFLAIEPWMSADMQLDRDGAFKGLIGGDPSDGTADLASYGVDAKFVGRIEKHLSVYVRGGPSIVEANGVLTGYRGYGMGVHSGLVVSGRVRALGFLWAPLFFVKRGPFITGSLYLDQGIDFYRLKMPGAPDLTGRVGHVSVGFSLGSDF